MALCSSLSLVPPITSQPKLTSKPFLSPTPPKWHGIISKSNNSKGFLLNAGFNEIEPDLNEDHREDYATNGVDPDDFEYGIYDGHHTYFEGQEEKGTFWGTIAEEIAAAEPPTGFQGLISWLFPPAIVAGVYFNVPGEYLFIATGIFTIVFCIIEMDKPDKPHHFEPHIYNMERGARDKLLNDYNTMSIWEFNEKYGDLWDTTIQKDDITKR
ncbi:photosynthetic NDH subunit of subcomplex B 5, chloroplastic [Abrus precatorius]|uniref:Photosynthetic NDH subunit of subcomplex B 5, chloroplastic n=1 Tax=Abrus precatorius TaxID=3816 RepID=A0A8B8ME50_ABRPR|nr:photosynthetic NDH subunit of subcomplex B 5, chloroplastic [Abrus precatorius]